MGLPLQWAPTAPSRGQAIFGVHVRRLSAFICGVAFATLLSACGGGSDAGPGPVVPPANVAPVASAGAAQSVAAGATVSLDGTASTDANADPLTYAWTLSSKPTGSTAVLDSASAAKPTFVADVAGSYVVSLTVNDGKLDSAAASVTITATASNRPPVSNAGRAQSVLVGALVTLDGSASADADGDRLTYAWTLTSRPAGSAALLAGAGSAAPSFTVDVAGSYVATLVVNDGRADSAPAAVGISASVANAPPVADAGPAQSVLRGAVVTLDGARSSDANGDPLTFAWTLTTRPAGSAAVLTAPTSAAPRFTADVAGSYVASLKVNDGQADSAPATVSISASVANAAPVANAGTPRSVQTGTLVVLDGAASSDANGDPLSYAWTLTARPAASTAVLAGATSAAPTFIADAAGSYVATLVVNDGQINSAPATVSVTASTANVAPVANAGSAQNVLAGSTVVLNGAASSDANGDPLTYAWTLSARPAGSSAALAAAGSATPSFTADAAGTYVVSLVVNDGKLNSVPATAIVTASAGNAVPVANAGTAQNVAAGAVVTLDGSASSDANGDALTYAWTFASRPNGSAAALAGATTAAPTFTADLAGTYVASLVVNDGKASSGAATVTVTARAPQSGLPVEELMTTASFGDVEFDWARDGVYCGSCNFGAGNARFNWVDRSNRLWVSNIDPDTGAIVPPDGRGVLVDTLAAYFSDYGNGPEWAFSALGSQLVYSRYNSAAAAAAVDDNNVGIGLAKMVNGSWTSGFLDGVLQRNSPAPSQTVTDAAPSMAYASSTSLDFYWRTLGNPPSAEVKTPIKTVGLSVRWLPGTKQFVYAEGVKDPIDGNTYQQVFFYDTAVNVPQQLTPNDQKQKRGAFMFAAPEFGGDQVFFTVADRTELQVYRKLPDGSGGMSWQVVNRITSPDSGAPYIASPEPFTYNGRTWIFLILSSSKAASDITVPTKLAVTGIDPAQPSIRLLQDDTSPVRLRQDPEYFITSRGAYIYYSRAIPGTATSGPINDGYYRVDTGLGPPRP